MRSKKFLAAFAALLMIVSAAALPASAATRTSRTPSGGIHTDSINARIESVPDYKVTYVYYNGQPYGTYTEEETYYRDISVPTGSHLVEGPTRTVVDFDWGFPSGDAGQLKSETHIYYSYKAVKD